MKQSAVSDYRLIKNPVPFFTSKEPRAMQAVAVPRFTTYVCTYKLHSLGDYTVQIRLYGTTDSYSTQPVCHTYILFWHLGDLTCVCDQDELEHQMSKGWFPRTSRKSFIPQLASIKHHQACIWHIHAQRNILNRDDPAPNSLEQHYVIGKSQNLPEDITQFVQRSAGDPITKISLLAMFP